MGFGGAECHCPKNFPFSNSIIYKFKTTSGINICDVVGKTVASEGDLLEQHFSDFPLVLRRDFAVGTCVGVDSVDCDFEGLHTPSMRVFNAQLLLQSTSRVLVHYGPGLGFKLGPHGYVQGPGDTGVRVLVECDGVEEGMKVHGLSLGSGDFDEVAAEVAGFEGGIEEVGVVEGLVDVADEVEEVPGHPGPLEGDSVFVELEDFVAPVDGVYGVDVLLVLSHAAETVVGVVDDVGEVVVIEDLDLVLLDVVGPNRSLGEGLSLAVGEGVEGEHQGVELVAGVEVVEVGEVVPGDLGGQHVALVPPGLAQHQATH